MEATSYLSQELRRKSLKISLAALLRETVFVPDESQEIELSEPDQWVKLVDTAYAFEQLAKNVAWREMCVALAQIQREHVAGLVNAQGDPSEHRVAIKLIDRILGMPQIAARMGRDARELLSQSGPTTEEAHA